MSEEQAEQQPKHNPHSAPLVIDEVIEMYESRLGAVEGSNMRLQMQQKKDYEMWSEKEKTYKDAIEAMTARISELEGNHPDESGAEEGGSEGTEAEAAIAQVKPLTKPQARKKGRQ